MPYVDVRGGRIYYESDGDTESPGLLLIHAGIASLRMWDPQIPSLALTHFVVRFDTRSYGRSQTTDVEYSEQDDAIAVLDHLGIATATIVGASRGGGIALDLVLEYPDRFRGLVVIGSAPGGSPEIELTPREVELDTAIEAAEEGGQWDVANRLEVEMWDFGPTRDANALDPQFVRKAYELHAANLVHAGEHPTRIRLDPPAYGRLSEIVVPALVVVGESDMTPELASAAYLAETLPRAQLVRIPDAAHLPNVERPVEFEAILSGWLDQHEL